MERQPQSSYDAYAIACAAVASFFKLSVDEEREEAHEVKPAEISPPGDGGEEQKAQSEPEQGAAAEGKEAGDEGEGEEGCDVSVGAAGPADGESREAEAEAEAGAGGGLGGEQGDEEQPPRAAVEGPEAADGQRCAPYSRLTKRQLQDLERVFRHTQYLSVPMRKELARRLGVTEARVQMWFKNRRAKSRRYHKALMLKNVPLVPLVPTAVVSMCEPCSAILLQELGWVDVLLEQLLLELSLLPEAHMPPMPPVPPVPPNPPMLPMLPVPPVPPIPPEPPNPPMLPMLPVPPEPPNPPMLPMLPVPPVPPNPPVPPIPPEPPNSPVPPVPPMPPFPAILLPPPHFQIKHLLLCRCPHAAWHGPLPLAVLQEPVVHLKLSL
ncbi:homeobox protein ESX1-like [Mesoplodon densirostris]|uniref:homeobox protein ESX1-like n=1 Tax=Mesoplodon densirostris TaxID=48708 RepID=UPI0028DBFA29|nr:homeobox protein ESX1-like [Mesoplodon densirostris]